MGFYFSRQAKLPARRGARASGLLNLPSQKAERVTNSATLSKLGCKACPLNTADLCTPKMPATIASDTLVMFLAEAPGKHEDETSGRPLTGPSGSLLRGVIPDEAEDRCSFDNVINCRPPDNRTPTSAEIACCLPRRAPVVEQARPALIVGLGAVPLHWALKSTDLAGMRGRTFAIKIGDHHCWFLPTYHPSFILRVAHNKQRPLNSRLGHCFRMDIARAFKLAGLLPQAQVDDPAEVRGNTVTFHGKDGDLDQIIYLFREAKRHKVKSIDLETTHARPYALDAKVLTVAIGYGNDFAFAFPLDHPKAGWSPAEKETLRDLIYDMVTDDTAKIAHNAAFEIEWLIHDLRDKGFVKHTVWEDTQVQAHILDERRGKQYNREDDKRNAYQKLGFLTKQYFGLDFKQLFKLPKKNMIEANLDETLAYNAVDAKYELRLHRHQDWLLEQHDLLYTYYDALPRQPTVALMQHLGLPIDQNEVAAAQKKLNTPLERLEAEVAALPVVKQYIADKGEFNPYSSTQVLELFKDYLKRLEVEIEGKFEDGKSKFRYSVDKSVLERIDHPLAKLLLKVRNLAKLKSTYVDCFEMGKGNCIWPDGLAHTSFNTTFTETGRLSSDGPNQQNWPQRNDAWVRKQVVAPKGYVILAADYGQLEACVAAMCSHDKFLVKALWEDYDIHVDWAWELAKSWPEIVGGLDKLKDPDALKRFRSRAKNKMVFPTIFGATVGSVASYLGMPEDRVEPVVDKFWGVFTGLHDWQDRTMSSYYELGYAETPNGRRRHYPLTRNQVINHPIQGGAAEIVCEAMNRVSAYAISKGKWHLHPRLNIHDDLTLLVPDTPSILDEAIEVLYTLMLSSRYKHVNVPLSVEISVGHNWFEMQKVGKFWSHKDL